MERQLSRPLHTTFASVYMYTHRRGDIYIGLYHRSVLRRREVTTPSPVDETAVTF